MNTNSNSNTNSNPADQLALKSEYKKQSFDREFRSFLKQAEETIIAKYNISIEFGNTRPELVCLKRYLSIYNNKDNLPQEHYCYFETLYNRKRSEILKCLKDDRWIRTGNVVIQFGEGVKTTPELEERRRQVRIMVSDIFSIACDLQKQAEKRLDGIDESLANDIGGKDLIRPSILLLHLMRIFYHLNDGIDKTPLGEIVTELEDALGVTKKTVGEDPWNLPAKPIESLSTGDSGGLSVLFTMATNMMETMGCKPPPGMKPPSEAEINNVINNVFTNKTTQDAIQGMFSSLQGSNDYGSAIQGVIKNITDPKTMEAIQGSVMQTARLVALDSESRPPIQLPSIESLMGSSASTLLNQ